MAFFTPKQYRSTRNSPKSDETAGKFPTQAHPTQALSPQVGGSPTMQDGAPRRKRSKRSARVRCFFLASCCCSGLGAWQRGVLAALPLPWIDGHDRPPSFVRFPQNRFLEWDPELLPLRAAPLPVYWWRMKRTGEARPNGNDWCAGIRRQRGIWRCLPRGSGDFSLTSKRMARSFTSATNKLASDLSTSLA